jgi:hypothetical protein
MGCCNDDKSCCGSAKPKRKIPWFSLILVLLVVLVVFNWQ